jgi:hypothetical protein
MKAWRICTAAMLALPLWMGDLASAAAQPVPVPHVVPPHVAPRPRVKPRPPRAAPVPRPPVVAPRVPRPALVVPKRVPKR